DAADHLVGQGVPFREAHRVVGQLVRYCLDEDRRLDALSLKELRRFSPKFGPEVTGRLSSKDSVSRRRARGGTARATVAAAVRRAETALSALKRLAR
ncbi:MAG: argininosuccinate lyase, partial [Myxococcota bacterium]